MKKIYLVRHGESEWNILKKVQGQQDIPLTEKGLQQAKMVANRLVNEKIDKIYTSDLIRAYKTAEIIGNMLNLEVTPMRELREINFGKWEGLTSDIISSKYSKEYCLWMKEPEKLQLEGAETLKQLKDRAIEGINKIINDNNVDNILVVSHSATLKMIILGLLNMDVPYYKNLSLSNVSLSVIENRKYNRVLSLLNDTNHLKESL